MKTIRLIIILSCLFISIFTFAQNKIKFTYDNSGNRTLREIVFKKSCEVLTDSSLLAQPIIEWMDEMKVTLYPNPTKGLLTVDISNKPEGVTGDVAIYTMDSRLLNHNKVSDESNQFDISNFPLGMYMLRIQIGQKRLEWKIIKE